jgi:hypothetical protein
MDPYLVTDGLWSNPQFTGGFDLVQSFAFFLPYLVGEKFTCVSSSKLIAMLSHIHQLQDPAAASEKALGKSL